jgi:2'-5' RNA ligase
MKRLAVVAYPELQELDRTWIESIRAKHDPQARQIAAHFTLVFPAAMEEEQLLAEARATAGSFASITFVLGFADGLKDPDGFGSHAFALVDEGKDQIIALHERLHAGSLRRLLDPSRPFFPHVTIAANADLKICKDVAHEFENEDTPVEGRITSIEVVEVLADSVRSIATFALAGASG